MALGAAYRIVTFGATYRSVIFEPAYRSVIFGATYRSVTFGASRRSVTFEPAYGSVIFGATYRSVIFGATSSVLPLCGNPPSPEGKAKGTPPLWDKSAVPTPCGLLSAPSYRTRAGDATPPLQDIPEPVTAYGSLIPHSSLLTPHPSFLIPHS